jgi:hypothetical protein
MRLGSHLAKVLDGTQKKLVTERPQMRVLANDVLERRALDLVSPINEAAADPVFCVRYKSPQWSGLNYVRRWRARLRGAVYVYPPNATGAKRRRS